MRKNDITYTKAIGIILMVMCHALNMETSFNSFVYIFHMPLFFFFSGYCLKTEYFNKPYKFVCKRLKGLYWPFVKWNMIFLMLHNTFFSLHLYSSVYGFHGVGSKIYSNSDVSYHLFQILLQMREHELLLGGYWFLRALFVGGIIAFFMLLLVSVTSQKMRIAHLPGYVIGGAILITTCVWINHVHYSRPNAYLITAQDFAAALLFYVGYGFRYFCIRKFRWYECIIALVIVLLGSYLWPMGLANQFYNNHKLLPYLFTAVLGSWGVYSLPWKRIARGILELLRYIGENTLSILTWHFLTFKMVSLFIIIIYHLPIERLGEFPVIVEYAARGWCIAYFLVGMIVTCAIAYCNRWIHNSWLKL